MQYLHAYHKFNFLRVITTSFQRVLASTDFGGPAMLELCFFLRLTFFPSKSIFLANGPNLNPKGAIQKVKEFFFFRSATKVLYLHSNRQQISIPLSTKLKQLFSLHILDHNLD